jgi:hypothetical protein
MILGGLEPMYLKELLGSYINHWQAILKTCQVSFIMTRQLPQSDLGTCKDSAFYMRMYRPGQR